MLSARATGDIYPADGDRVDVTVKRIVNGATLYVFVNRVYESIVRLGDGVELAWTDADFCTWLTSEVNAAFTFSHIISLDATSYPRQGLSFEMCGCSYSRPYEQRSHLHLPFP